MDEGIGERLRRARACAGITQAELAGVSGVGIELIGKLERGARATARIASLARLADALGVNVADLIGKPALPAPANPETLERLAEAIAEARRLPVVVVRTTALYRYFDDKGRLLYVGIATSLPKRQRSHVRASSWMEFAVRATIARYPSRDAALQAEKAAIEEEAPLFNSMLNDSPEARLRLVEYLIEQRRPDLLTAAVSRG